MRTVLLASGLICLSVVPAGGAAAADPRATIVARSCNSCHGPDGYSPGAIPSIRGMPQQSFIKAMQDFRSGRRSGTIMGRLAKAYSDAEIRAMAEYFSNLQ
jgi:cytochrome subunit of sulfide dehydrogenase